MFLFPFAIIKINRRYIILSDVRCNYMMGIGEQILHAEISVIPIGTNSGTSMSKEIASAFDAILSKGLRTVPNQRYQRPSELRQDLLAMRSVSGTLVSGKASDPVFQSSSPNFVSKNGQQTHAPTQQASDQVAQALPLLLNPDFDMEEQVLLLPKPEDLPPMKARNDTLHATILLGLILVVLIVVVVMSQMTF